ncbi:MAG: hypothetical protein WAN50_03990 [Minisyncoccia bacterium]
MVVRKTVSLPQPLTGQQIIGAVSAAVKANNLDLINNMGFDDGACFEVGQSSGYPYEQLRVIPEIAGETVFHPDRVYRGPLVVESHKWPVEFYPVGYSDDAPIWAVESFAAALDVRLRDLASQADSQVSESLLEQFERRYDKAPTDPAKRILFGIFNDLNGRAGFDNEWGGIDHETQEEILATNLEIVRKNLP